MRHAILARLCFFFVFLVLLPGYVLADQPDPERIAEILRSAQSALATAKVYQPEISAIQTRSRARARLYQHTVTGTVVVITESSLGSGVRVAREMIVTNWHVVEGEKHAAILFWRPDLTDTSALSANDLVPAVVLKTDPLRDLALLIVDPKKVSPYASIIQTGRLSDIAIGQDVFAIGHPEKVLWSYGQGVVSQILHNQAWRYESSKQEHRGSAIEMQIPISFGNSGGPLVDERGRLIGLNTGLNFAVAVDEVNSFISEVGLGRVAEAAFVIYLRDGKELLAEQYWESGDEIRYHRFGGELSIRKTRVAVIENRETGEKRILNVSTLVEPWRPSARAKKPHGDAE